MAQPSREKHGFFQSIQSVLPTHNPLHRHARHSDSTSPIPASSLPNNVTTKTHKQAERFSNEDALTAFRYLVGIDNPEGLVDNAFFRRTRPADNLGIYHRVVNKEAKAAKDYKWFSGFISFCISAQVLVAACLTALGAGNASHRAVTAFGALNTVLAGFMAYFKGSGLPNRLKYYKNEWTKLREYIEQRERDFCRQDHNLDLEAEVSRIERMYEEVKGDIEANTPDSFVSVRDISRRGEKVGARAAVDVEKVGEAVDRRVSGLQRNLSYQSTQFGDKLAGYGNEARRYGDEKITGYGNQAARYGDEKLAAATAYGDDKIASATRYGDEKLASAQNYGNERLNEAQTYGTERLNILENQATQFRDDKISSAQNYGNEQLASAQSYGNEAVRPYQEAAAGYQQQAEEAKEKLGDLGQKAYNIAGRVSSFLERPPRLGVHVESDGRHSPPPAGKAGTKDDKKGDDVV